MLVTISSLALLALAFSLSATCTESYGFLRLTKFCDGGNQTGKNRTLVHARNKLDCALACNMNMDCNFMSYHDIDCSLYKDEPECGTGDGTTRAVYKIDPQCEKGWHHYNGSCYFVSETELASWYLPVICYAHGSLPVAIRNEAENEFLTLLLHSHNISDKTIRLGCVYDPNTGEGAWTTFEPWVFQNWRDVEPGSGPCVAMNSSDGKWQTEDCSQNMIGICEKPL